MQILTFKSKINQNDNENIIEFSSPVQISKYKNFDVFEFEEPSQKIMNRIEINMNLKMVNIFAGQATINLSLDQKLQIPYLTPHGYIYLISYMDKLEFNKQKNEYILTYTLSNQNNIIGTYAISLKLK